MTREEALYCMKANSVLHSEICEECPLYGNTGVDHCFEDALDEVIKALEQEPKTGHWIKYGVPRCGEQHYKCTSCGYYINFGQWGEVFTKQFKYCPNCGAKMEVKE